jgi:hypothetical protein
MGAGAVAGEVGDGLATSLGVLAAVFFLADLLTTFLPVLDTEAFETAFILMSALDWVLPTCGHRPRQARTRSRRVDAPCARSWRQHGAGGVVRACC